MYKVFKKTKTGEEIVYRCEDENDAINVALKYTENGNFTFVSDFFQDIVYETFMLNDVDQLFI